MSQLLLVGCGKMGEALLQGWIEQGTAAAEDITVVEPNPDIARALTHQHGVSVVADAQEIKPNFMPDVVVLAVKPQVMDSVLPPYVRFATVPSKGDNAKGDNAAKGAAEGAVFLSIAAGRTLHSFASILGPNAAVVRAMPNTPASIKRAITVGCPNAHVTPAQERLCKTLLCAVGEVEWIENETLLDAVTAVSGSGPAYVFLLAEAMTHAGHMVGLPPELSERLARATISGSGALLRQSALPAATLRENVTSPNGTTAAALEVLMTAGGLKDVMVEAIAAATQRSKELASR